MGTLVDFPKETVSKAGKTFAVFDLAVGEATFNLCAFGQMKSRIMGCHKGDVIAVLGELSARKYTDKNGMERSNLGVYVKDLTVQMSAPRPTEEAKPLTQNDLDDIPF